ncbi:unnamed protein product [Brassicogethes aeneus]|uniref:Uncharacterized protein n=1 Tax=Brassicogethes aeneus TaxID=1431903 RepID=A0A9P0ATQ3_BRAAE|nr:unnamed protein product [Brassicogethes aeneus]
MKVLARVKIYFNVNHTVDADAEPELHENLDKPEIGELKSKPSFKVELVRGKTTVSILCSFVAPSDQDDGYSVLRIIHFGTRITVNNLSLKQIIEIFPNTKTKHKVLKVLFANDVKIFRSEV